MFLREALNKMKDVYEKNPQMGDPGSLQPKLAETMNNIDRLRMEIHKNEVHLLTQQFEIKVYFKMFYKLYCDRLDFARLIYQYLCLILEFWN